MSESKSERELLFSRVQKQKVAESLARNVEKLTRTEEKLQSSRLSSASSQSLNSLRRAYSTASHQKSGSKEKLLKEIIQKLRESKPSKEALFKKISEEREGEGRLSEGESGGRKGSSRMSKLQEMMKDIKRCNQMSTKAVYSIKKNINQQLTSASHKGDDEKATPNILLLVNEVAALKQQLTAIKQENKQLISIIQQRQKQCQLCTCHCHISK